MPRSVSKRRVKFRWSHILCGLAITLGACQPGSYRAREIAPTAVSLARVPGTGLGSDDWINMFDFVADSSGALHFVWFAFRSASAKSRIRRTEIWYQRADLGGATWSRPELLEPDASGPGPRIVIAEGALHVFANRRLRHWASHDGGTTWSELHGDLSSVGAFNAAQAEDGSILVPFEQQVEAPGYDRVLRVMRWSKRGSTISPDLAHVDHKIESLSPSGPRVVSYRGRLQLFDGVRESLTHIERRNGRPVEVSTSRGRLFHVANDGGSSVEHWNATEDLLSHPTYNGSLEEGDIAVLADSARLALFHCAFPVRFELFDSSGTWMKRGRLTPEDHPFLGSYETSSVGVARSVAGRVRLVWIDSRYRKSDRSFWLPLGGIPWSDSPEWANNDVFTLVLPSDLDSLATLGIPVPERLTRRDSQASSVQIRAVGDRFCVAWIGRSKVGHGFGHSAGHEIYYTFLN